MTEPTFAEALRRMPWGWAAIGCVTTAALVAALSTAMGIHEAYRGARIACIAGMTITLGWAYATAPINTKLAWAAIGVLGAGAGAATLLHMMGAEG